MTKRFLLVTLLAGSVASQGLAAGWVLPGEVTGRAVQGPTAATTATPDDGIKWIEGGIQAGVRPQWNNDYQHPDIHDLAAEVAGWEGHKSTHSHTLVVKPPREPHYRLSHMMTSYEMGNGWSVPVSHDPHTRVTIDWQGQYPAGRYSAPMATPSATLYTSTPGCSAAEQFRQVHGCSGR